MCDSKQRAERTRGFFNVDDVLSSSVCTWNIKYVQRFAWCFGFSKNVFYELVTIVFRQFCTVINLNEKLPIHVVKKYHVTVYSVPFRDVKLEMP